MSRSLEILNEVFGYPVFRGQQGEIVEHVAEHGLTTPISTGPKDLTRQPDEGRFSGSNYGGGVRPFPAESRPAE